MKQCGHGFDLLVAMYDVGLVLDSVKVIGHGNGGSSEFLRHTAVP